MTRVENTNTSDYDKKQFIIQYGIDKNNPCLCGSGKVFKSCCWKDHERKEADESISWSSSIHTKSLSKKEQGNVKCMFADCDQKAIKSHLFSKGTQIKPLLRQNEHIHRFVRTLRNGKIVTLKQDNRLKEATTFKGFCALHDNAVFEHLDQNSVIDSKALLALTYRSIAYQIRKLETDRKVMIKKHFKFVPKYYSNELVSEASLDFQVHIIKLVSEMGIQLRALYNLLRAIEKSYDCERRTWNFKNNVLRFSKTRTLKLVDSKVIFSNAQVVTNGLHQSGHILTYDAKANGKSDIIITFVLPNQDSEGADVVFATQLGAGKTSHRFIDQINKAKDEDICAVVNNLILSNMDDFYFTDDLIDWIHKNDLMERIEVAVQQPMLFNYNDFLFEHMKTIPYVSLLKLL